MGAILHDNQEFKHEVRRAFWNAIEDGIGAGHVDDATSGGTSGGPG